MTKKQQSVTETFTPAAMIMAAGLGTRMRPLSLTRPKPLIELNGKPLIDYALQRLTALNIRPIVVNVHYLADLLEEHLIKSKLPDLIIADERLELLDTGGGAKANLDTLGPGPFFILNSDTLWRDEDEENLKSLQTAWDDEKMDCLMLLAVRNNSLGYSGEGDFNLDDQGRLSRRKKEEKAPFVHTGCCLIHPRLFDSAPEGAFSLNLVWDKALLHGRLFGVALKGLWMHIGTPEALIAAEKKLNSKP